MIAKLLAVVSGLVLVAACSAASTEQPATDPAFSLLKATQDGAIALDITGGSLVGFDRFGKRQWSDRDALQAGADATCLAVCPDAVFSGAGQPWQVTAGQRANVAVQANHVLAAQSPSDTVFVTDTTLVVARPDGSADRITVTDPQQAWFENASRTDAVAFAPGSGGGNLLRFQRDQQGWHLVDDKTPRGKAWGACLAGDFVALVGEEPAILVGGQRLPMHTDLRSVGECAFGTAGGAVVQRSVHQDQKHRTAVRGVDLRGQQTWSRDLNGEASVAADPAGRLFALAHGGKLELVDSSGKTVSTRDNVDSAMFTSSGELVTISPSGQTLWSPAR